MTDTKLRLVDYLEAQARKPQQMTMMFEEAA